MKKLISLIAFFLLASPILKAQNEDNKLLIEEYLRQSEKQKKTGWTLIGAGAGAAALGLVLAASSDDWSDSSFGSGIILFVVGSASTVLGIPVLISSASKARKAGRLSLGTQTVRAPIFQNSSWKIYPSLNFSVPLHSTKK